MQYPVCILFSVSLLYRLCSLPAQILMSVSRVASITVMKMLTALIPLEVTTAVVYVAMKEMDSTVQVIQACVVHNSLPIMLSLFIVTQ